MRYDDTDLQDRLAGEYVLGTLPERTRRRFETLMHPRPEIRERVVEWQGYLGPLDEEIVPVEPPCPDRRGGAAHADRQVTACEPGACGCLKWRRRGWRASRTDPLFRTMGRPEGTAGALSRRNVRPFVLGEHGEKEDRHVGMSIKVQDAIAAAFSAPGRATRTFRKPPPRATPHSGSSASSDTPAMRSSSLMPTAAARRRNSGVSTTVWRHFGTIIYTSLTHMPMTHPFRTVSPNNIGFFAAVRLRRPFCGTSERHIRDRGRLPAPRPVRQGRGAASLRPARRTQSMTRALQSRYEVA